MGSRVLVAALLAAVGLPCLSPLPAQSSRAATTALVGGLLIDGSGNAAVPDAVVVLSDGRITAAGPADRVAVPRDATVIRVDGKTIMPGMIEGTVTWSSPASQTTPPIGVLAGPKYYEIGARNLLVNLMQGELGMTPMEAIVSATRRGAEVLKKDGELGTITAGKLADVIVVDGNPLERISDLRKVAMVFKGGVRYK